MRAVVVASWRRRSWGWDDGAEWVVVVDRVVVVVVACCARGAALRPFPSFSVLPVSRPPGHPWTMGNKSLHGYPSQQQQTTAAASTATATTPPQRNSERQHQQQQQQQQKKHRRQNNSNNNNILSCMDRAAWKQPLILPVSNLLPLGCEEDEQEAEDLAADEP